MFTVIAHYRTRPDRADDVRAVLTGHARASNAEPGCLGFAAHQDADDPTRFALYEVYRDRAAFEEHRRTEHFRVNVEETIAPLLLERTWQVFGPPLGDPAA